MPRSDLFSSFTSKISGIVSSCIRPVLESLAAQAGILLVLCCQSDGFGYSNIDDSIASSSSLSLAPNPSHHVRERLIIAQPYGSASGQAVPPSAAGSLSSHPAALERGHSDDYARSLKKHHPLFDALLVADQYSVLSAHDALLSLAGELLSVYHDVCVRVRLQGRDSSLYLQRWQEQRNSFIVVYSTRMDRQLKPAIQQTASLLHKGHSNSISPAAENQHARLAPHSLCSCLSSAVCLPAVLVLASNLKS